jgi:hypothetical protein
MVSKICEILIIDTQMVLRKTIPVQLTCSNHHLLGYSPSDLLEICTGHASIMTMPVMIRNTLG